MVDRAPLRIVFFGTPAFAVPTLQVLLASRHAVVAVVTQPDRPRGRGQKTTHAPIKASATAAGVTVLQPDSIKDPGFVGALSAMDADLGVVAAYGKILTDAVLAVPRLGMVNVHASLLPRYRGAAPVHRAIIAGERETGITIMRMVRALDAGPMLATTRRPIGPDETSEDVERDLARIGAALAVSTIEGLIDGRVSELAQNDADATYAHRLAKDDGVIDWALSANQIHNRIRGLHPWPHGFTFLSDRRLILLRSTPSADVAGGEPGTVQEASGDRLRVATGAGVLSLLELQAEGKRPMPAREFLAGHTDLRQGARLRAPA
jgi:methionyl-tRNA formyltransferase